MVRKSMAADGSKSPNSGLRGEFHNRNLDNSQVLGHTIKPQEQHMQGFYKSQMNKGTSQVNWGDVADNKAKIAEYNNRMLN